MRGRPLKRLHHPIRDLGVTTPEGYDAIRAARQGTRKAHRPAPEMDCQVEAIRQAAKRGPVDRAEATGPPGMEDSRGDTVSVPSNRPCPVLAQVHAPDVPSEEVGADCLCGGEA